jgi:hypothetical protein
LELLSGGEGKGAETRVPRKAVPACTEAVSPCLVRSSVKSASQVSGAHESATTEIEHAPTVEVDTWATRRSQKS